MYLGEGIGQLYVEKHFPPAAKERMLDLVHNLQAALGERIKNLDWMSDETKTEALAKLNTFRIKIGYPDKWRLYDDLVLNKKESYLDNIIRCEYFYVDDMISDFNQPVDKDKWFTTPQTVNAFYNPSENSINFPAAILQPPFFNMEADDAVNYGAIGAIIGHEMTHGFDDSGRNFDKDGNLLDWWTEEDAARFNERSQVLVDYFDALVVLGDTHANGRLTLGENIADLGGLQVAWQAYQNSLKVNKAPLINDFTGAQRFFLAFASCFASNIRDETMLYLTQVNPHSLDTWRINGTLPQIDVWYDAFTVTPDQTLYIPKEKRASIW
jgi:putative endopeptidase